MTKITDIHTFRQKKKEQSSSPNTIDTSAYSQLIELLVETHDDMQEFGGGLIIPDPADPDNPDVYWEVFPTNALMIIKGHDDKTAFVPTEGFTVADLIRIHTAMTEVIDKLKEVYEEGGGDEV